MAAPTVHFVTRKGLVSNARIFKQVDSLRRAGYEVVLLGVRRGSSPARDERDGVPVIRVEHDPLPHAVSAWARRGSASPTTAGAVPVRAGGSVSGGGGAARALLMRGIRRAGTAAWLLQSAAFYVRAFRALQRLPAPDVVHVNDLNALAVGVAHARRHSCPLVYDAQELFTGIHTLPRGYRALLRAQERLLLRFVDRFVVVNPAIGDEMERLHGRRPDAVVLNCPPYADPGPGADLRAALELPAAAPVLVYSGGLLPDRGIEQTVLALHHLPDAALVILGEGVLRGELEALARREGLADRVRFHEFVPHGAVPGLIAGADVGVVPYRDVGVNHRLGSPSKLFHYLMAGLPVACSDLPYMRGIVGASGVGAVFDAAEPASIARAVGDVLAGADGYRRAVAEARRHYTWEQQERVFLAVYRSVLTGDARRASPPHTRELTCARDRSRA